MTRFLLTYTTFMVERLKRNDSRHGSGGSFIEFFKRAQLATAAAEGEEAAAEDAAT